MKITINKKDGAVLFLLILLFLMIAQEGIIKYGVLSAAIVICLLLRKKLIVSNFIILIHAAIYVVLGLILSVATGNITFDSIKQALIYLCSGLFAISFFTVYGRNKSVKLVNLQFFALCIGYLILYARYFTLDAFGYESNIFAYIFGVYGLIYFCQKKYKMMALAIVFMLFDHKRIADCAFIFALLSIFLIKFSKKQIYHKILNILGAVVLFIVPLVWVYLCSNEILASLFASLEINTMGRTDGTGAWGYATRFYDFSPIYIGKGIGWVLNWLNQAGIGLFSNLHNDFLVAYIELGFIFFIIWLLAFLIIPFSMRNKDLKMANLLIVLIGFMFINFLTDNIYIYVTFLCPFYIILLSILFGNDNQQYKKNI